MAAPRPLQTAGLFIAFEGVEGAGKSTQIRMLSERLEAEGREVLVTREPGGAALAERIRQLVLDPATEDMGDRTEALLIAAARADHVQHTIRPALEDGRVVLCDRFIDSSLAYQGHGRGLGVDDVAQVNRWAVDGVVPDAVVLLKLDPEKGLRRIAERAAEGRSTAGNLVTLPHIPPAQGLDRMEREDVEFHRRVARGYLDLARRDRDRWMIVEADSDADTIHRQVRAVLHRWLPLPEETPLHGTTVVDTEQLRSSDSG